MSRMIRMMALVTWMLPAVVAADVVEVDLTIPSPVITKDAEGFTRIHVEGFANLRIQAGTPELPTRTVHVLLPRGHRATSVGVRASELVPLPGNHVVYPRQRPWPLSQDKPSFTQPDPVIYDSDTAWPGARVQALDPQAMRGFVVVPVRVNPVSYRPGAGTLLYAPSLTVVVVTEPGRAMEGTLVRHRGLGRDFDRVRSLVANPDALRSYPLHKDAGRNPDYRYIVVTSSALAACGGSNNFQALTADKESRGISTLIKTMESIRTEYAGVDDEEKVRNFIKDMYENHATDFVLLAGDDDLSQVGGETEATVVPVRGLWGDIGYGVEDNVPSDLYYACLDGDYNANGNSIWGEPSDGIDTLAEVWTGRAPVDSCTEVANFVRKTLAYQNAGGDWLTQVYMVGEVLFEGYYGKDDLQHVHNTSSEGGYSTQGFSESSFFQVNTMYDADLGDEGWGASEMLGLLNGGNHIINHLGHSYTNYNMRLITDDIISGMTNNQYFFQYTQGCYPGAFDNRLDPQAGNQVIPQDSFVEHFVLDQHGAFAAIQNTRYGLGAGYSNALHRYFWDAAFGQGMNHLGEMHGYSLEQIAGWISDPGFRWVFYECTLFGDPEQAVHLSMGTDEPYIGLPAGPVRFVVVEGEGNPSDQTIRINNVGGGTLNWAVTSSQAWLTTWPESGTAPTDIALSVDATGLGTGAHNATLTFTAPGATNSPQTLEVILNVITVPTAVAPYVASAPTVDGVIGVNEYAGATVLGMGLNPDNPQSSKAYMMHDGSRLYLALEIGDDMDADLEDTIVLLTDNDHDGLWPTAPTDEGQHQFYADSTAVFFPAYNTGSGIQYGDYDYPAPGISTAYSSGTPRVAEVSIDLSQSHLQVSQGNTFGMFLFFYDFVSGEDFVPVAYWPWNLATYDTCQDFGAVTLGTVGDCLTVDPDSMTFTAVEGGEDSAPQSLTIGSSSANSLSFSVSATPGWLHVSETSGSTPEMIQVWADPTGQTPGVKSGSITITSGGACNSPYNVPVTFTVEAQPAVIAVDPPSVYFEAMQHGPNPSAQTLSVTNLGGGTLTWSATKDAPWFVLSETGGTAPSTLTVVPVRTDLAAETFIGTITFTAQGAEPLEVPVSYRITLPPKLRVSPESIVHASALAEGPVEVVLEVVSDRQVAMEWYIGEDSAWISVNPTSGTAIPGHPSRVTVTLDPAGLSAGTHEAEITVNAPGAEDSPAAIPVSWTLEDAPAIDTTPDRLDFVGFVGGADPASQSLTINNVGTGDLTWNVTCAESWLTCDPVSGAAGAQVTVSTSLAGLAEGIYTGVVSVASDQAANSPFEVPVELVVTGAGQPVIAVDPQSLAFQASEGGQAPAAQTLSITNAGQGALDWSLTCGQAWLSCLPTSGSAPGTVTVTVNPDGLQAGTYQAEVAIASAQAVNSPVAVDVTFQVRSGPDNLPPPAPELLSPSTSADLDNPNPELTIKNVTDPDGDTVTYTFEVTPVDSDTPWTTIKDVPQGAGGMTSTVVEKSLDFFATYRWRARAVDEHGLAGEWSDQWLFTVTEPAGRNGNGCGCTASGRNGPLQLGLMGLVFGLLLARRREGS